MGVLRTCRASSPPPRVDYHMHTPFSDGQSTIEAYADRAVEMGLEEIAITDHVWRSSDWVAEYVETVGRIDDASDVSVHAGLEAKVIDRDGTVDVTPEDAARVDFVMGVVHRYRPEAEAPFDDSCRLNPADAAEEERDLTIALVENPTVDVIGHPTRTYYKFHYEPDGAPFPDDHIDAMVEASEAGGTPLEYNARLPTEIRERLLDHYLDANLPFTIGSDSHHVDRLSNLDYDHVSARTLGEAP